MDEWDRLDRLVEPRTPFTSAAWIIPWWKHVRRRRQVVFHDEFYCHAARDQSGRLVAIAPLMRTDAPGVGPPVLRMLQFFGADAAMTEVRGVICRPDDEARVVEALVRHFLARRGEWDVFRWSGLRQPVQVYGAGPEGFAFLPRGEIPDYIIDLSGSWEDLRQAVSSNMRKNLRKQYELLERNGLAFSVRVVERPEDVAGAMERFLALHAARADAQDMIARPNRFVQSRLRALLADYLRGAAERSELRIFELEIGGSIVAIRLAFLLGSDLYIYFGGYDPAWKDYSVMTVLMTEMIKWAFAQGVERVNLSTGNDQSKARWKPREVLFRDAVQISPTLRARTALQAFYAYEALWRAREAMQK